MSTYSPWDSRGSKVMVCLELYPLATCRELFWNLPHLCLSVAKACGPKRTWGQATVMKRLSKKCLHGLCCSLSDALPLYPAPKLISHFPHSCNCLIHWYQFNRPFYICYQKIHRNRRYIEERGFFNLWVGKYGFGEDSWLMAFKW